MRLSIAGIINIVYLCTRKSAYCAGLLANNTLKKSDLTFSLGRSERFFPSVFVSPAKRDDT